MWHTSVETTIAVSRYCARTCYSAQLHGNTRESGVTCDLWMGEFKLNKGCVDCTQGHGRLVRGQQGRRRHAEMAEEEPAPLQPALRQAKTSGDTWDGAAQPGQHLPDQHRNPSASIRALISAWHAEGTVAEATTGIVCVHLFFFLTMLSWFRLWTHWHEDVRFAWLRR